MKVQITITGGISGNRRIWNKLDFYPGHNADGNYGTLYVYYPTKKEAVKALKQAYRALKEDEPDYGQISHSKEYLRYDASTATIEPVSDWLLKRIFV